VETAEERSERLNAERAEEMERVPFQTIDHKRWPKNVRRISTGESDGIGIDRDGRLHWDGKPVEIVGSRLDLTTWQMVLAIIVAAFTVVGGIGAAAQGWAAYHDWACRNKQPAFLACPVPGKP
jgi:hypothetical protein